MRYFSISTPRIIDCHGGASATTYLLLLSLLCRVIAHLVFAHLVGASVGRAISPVHCTSPMHSIVSKVALVLLARGPDEFAFAIFLVIGEAALVDSSIGLVDLCLAF